MSKLEAWFHSIDWAVAGSEAAADGIGPNTEETKLLLDIGKLVADRAPERYFAMLTAFAVGRILGRSERERMDVDPMEFLRWAASKIEQVTSNDASAKQPAGASSPEGRIES